MTSLSAFPRTLKAISGSPPTTAFSTPLTRARPSIRSPPPRLATASASAPRHQALPTRRSTSSVKPPTTPAAPTTPPSALPCRASACIAPSMAAQPSSASMTSPTSTAASISLSATRASSGVSTSVPAAAASSRGTHPTRPRNPLTKAAGRADRLSSALPGFSSKPACTTELFRCTPSPLPVGNAAVQPANALHAQAAAIQRQWRRQRSSPELERHQQLTQLDQHQQHQQRQTDLRGRQPHPGVRLEVHLLSGPLNDRESSAPWSTINQQTRSTNLQGIVDLVLMSP
jgi:hypothetical protein